MPPLENPRWEAFAQAIVKGLASDRPNGKNTQKAAYLAAGYSAADNNSAESAASRLLRNVKPVVERIQELQSQALARIQPKLDVSRERIGRRLDLASRNAEQAGNHAVMVASELGLAKVFGLAKPDDTYSPTDLRNAQSSRDLGRLLLVSVGLLAPSDDEISMAVEANDRFVETLERIRDTSPSLPQ